jgi:hypothetical protein
MPRVLITDEWNDGEFIFMQRLDDDTPIPEDHQQYVFELETEEFELLRIAEKIGNLAQDYLRKKLYGYSMTGMEAMTSNERDKLLETNDIPVIGL